MTDTNILLTRLRKSRQSTLKIGEYTFTVRRPTAYEAAVMFQSDPTPYDVACEYVDDWAGVKDRDLVPSGGSDAADFDKTLFAEWLADKPDLWDQIFNHVITSYTGYNEKVSEAGKV